MHDRIITSEERRMVRVMTKLAEGMLALNPYDSYFSAVLSLLGRIERTRYISPCDREELEVVNGFY
jgi:hypothetical protein